MRTKSIGAVAGLTFAIAVAVPVCAFECPQHLAEAQAAIDKTTADMQGMSKMMAKHDTHQVHGLLNRAKTLLVEARHSHDHAGKDHDHAVAIAKAGSARGYAVAADIFHFKLMQKMHKPGMPMQGSHKGEMPKQNMPKHDMPKHGMPKHGMHK